jgi:RNA polymerase sigma factor (sigma-70 family)
MGRNARSLSNAPRRRDSNRLTCSAQDRAQTLRCCVQRCCNGPYPSADIGIGMKTRNDEAVLANAADAELLTLSKARPEAFGEFFERHHRKVLAFFYRRTACREIASDLTSETFAAAFLARRRYRDTGAPAEAWLLAIARRKLADTLRRGRAESKARRRLGLRSIPLGDSTIEELEEPVDLRSMRGAVREAMVSLPASQAEAVYMRVGLELPYVVIARRLECSEGTARMRVMRGLARLSDAVGVT